MADITFVVYRKDNYGREKHIGAINSFSAKLRHSRRRQQQATASKKATPAVQKKCVPNEQEHERREQLANDALALYKQAGAGTIDPFGSTKIAIDHNVHRVLSFDLRTLVGYVTPPGKPAYGEDQMRNGALLYGLRTNTRHYLVTHLLGGRVTYAEEEEASVRALDSAATGYAYLSCRATVMGELSGDPDMNCAALHFKQDAIRKLRNDLSTSSLAQNFEEKIKAIHSLFTAEIAARNFEAAQAHSMVLKYLLESEVAATLVATNLSVFQGVLWQEVHRALLSMTEVNLDLEYWTELLGLPTGLSFWEPFYDTASSPTEDDYQEPLLHENLYTIMHKIMELASAPAAIFYDAPRSTLVKLSAQGLILQCRLFNRYVQNTAWLSEATDACDLIRERARVESYMCLAILYWLRRAMFNEKSIINSTTRQVYSISSTFRERLQSLLSSCESDFEPDSLKAKSQLFASYVGAIAEQSEMADQKYIDVSSVPFHNKNFVLQACLMGLTMWSEVRDILSEFVYHEGIGTVAQVWFERVQQLFDFA